MIGAPCSLGRPSPRLLAVLVVCLAPALARAETMVFRNECRVPVVIHTTYVFRGKLCRNKPYLLRFGDCTPKIRIAGPMEVYVFDGRVPNRMLFKGAVRDGRKPLYFSVAPVPRNPARVQMIRRPFLRAAGMGGR
jgi:hypothetical protein